MVRGVSEGDRHVTRCDMIRVMGWDRLIEYLGEVWEEVWDAVLFKLKAAETSMPQTSQHPIFFPFSGCSPKK